MFDYLKRLVEEDQGLAPVIPLEELPVGLVADEL